jgi:hypothetical protein
MQTVVWMAYSDPTHFSDTNSYKILCFSSYQLKDMILARFEHLQQFSEKSEKLSGVFLTRRKLATEADEQDRKVLIGR